MNKPTLYTIFILTIVINNTAFGASEYLYANTFTTNNIMGFQHSIMTGAMQNFEGTASVALGKRARLIKHTENVKTMYGYDSTYGGPHLYGEYGDDGNSVGRNGGDTTENTLPVINSTWLAWQHFDDKVKFNGYEELETDTDLIMFGLTGGGSQLSAGISEWGVFGGYIGGDQTNKFITINENGGYFGLYKGYKIQKFNISFTADIGALYNKAQSLYGYDEFSNMWAGAAANATYNIALDDTFTLQPGVYAGYTWIGSANYISVSNDKISNKNLNTFEVAPGIRAIKHVGRGWFGFLNFKYAFMMGHGGDVIVNGQEIDSINTRDYAEYGIGIEKSIDRFNISLNINRRDGGRTGWNGGFNMKYLF